MNRVYWSLPAWLAFVLLPVWVCLALMWLVVVLPVKVFVAVIKWLATPNIKPYGRY